MASQNEIAQMIEQAAARYGVAPEALMSIANIESSGNVNAQNPRSSASGLFQFVDRTAREYGLTGNRRNDPAAQADAAARMMATNSRSLERTLGRTPQPGELYLAHQQGLTGATALLRNPNRPAVDVLTEVYGDRTKAQNAVRLNGGNTNMNAGQFAGTWVNKANQRTGLVPPGELPQVATQLDVRRPVTGSPQTMPASLGAQRNLTAQLSQGQTTAPDASFYGGIYAQPQPQQPVLRPFDPQRNTPRPNADGSISTEVTRTVQFPDGSWGNVPSLWWGNGSNYRDLDSMDDDKLAEFAARYESQSGQKFPRYTSLQQAETQAQQRSNMGAGTTGSITNNLSRPGAIDASVRGAASGQNQPLASALERYAQQQAQRVPYSQGQTVGTVSTRPAAQPRQPNAQERAALAYVAPAPVPYSAGRTVATVPTRPDLPPIAPSRTASPRVFSETTARTAAATQPALQSALQRKATPALSAAAQRADNGQTRPAPSMINTSMARAQAATNPALQVALANRVATPAAPARPVATASLNAPQMTSAQRSALSAVPASGVGKPPATRVVPSVPWGQPAIPGPRAAPKDQSRLSPQGALPIAASAAPPGPPIMVSGARQSVSGYPTPASQRPTGGVFAATAAPVQRPVARMPVMGMPTPLAQRPMVRQPLQVVVQGANTQRPPVQQQVINPANHNAAQLAALRLGQSTFVSSPGSVSEPVRAMNGKLRNTY